MTDESDNKRPHLKLTVENNQRDIDTHRVAEHVGWELRQLTSNLMRVARGAGKAYDIGKQCQAVVDAYLEYRDVVGHWPTTWELTAAIDVSDKYDDSKLPDEVQEHNFCFENIVLGSLQVAASRLVGQNTQVAAGRSQVSDALHTLWKQREARMIARAMAQRTASKKRAKPAPKKKAGSWAMTEQWRAQR